MLPFESVHKFCLLCVCFAPAWDPEEGILISPVSISYWRSEMLPEYIWVDSCYSQAVEEDMHKDRVQLNNDVYSSQT